jgi:DNA transposition AAA+ family ATPase
VKLNDGEHSNSSIGYGRCSKKACPYNAWHASVAFHCAQRNVGCRLAARQAWGGPADARVHSPELVIVDEADRLKTASLEQARDIYDRRHVGLVLIGMPGLQKRLARYAQLYSRIGFVHHFRSLTGHELQQIIERQTVQLGLGLELHTPAEADVVSAIARATHGNFRLIERLFAQIERVVQINELPAITPEVVAVASESLVIGPI